MKSIIDIYKRQRKYTKLAQSYKKQYAFVGIGNHSLNNLYPVLNFLKVPLKYIVTNSQKTANVLNASTWEPKATNDFNVVLDDPEISGVFISTSPENHYTLIKKALKKNKNVFVEKPPCYTLEELNDLISCQKESCKHVLVGLQKRYAPAYRILKKKMQHSSHYSMKYCTGAYPEGDPIMDLFIHPIDIIVHLFGEADINSLIRRNGTLLVHVIHKTGVAGALELSTDYSWMEAIEHLSVIEKNGIYELNNSVELLFCKKPSIIAHVPIEKILPFTFEKKILFNQNHFMPILQHNNIYVNGYYSELKTFVNNCENNKYIDNISSLPSLIPTYQLLEKIKLFH